MSMTLAGLGIEPSPSDYEPLVQPLHSPASTNKLGSGDGIWFPSF